MHERDYTCFSLRIRSLIALPELEPAPETADEEALPDVLVHAGRIGAAAMQRGVIMELTKSSIVNRSGGFIDVKIDEELVALNIDTGVCYSLNNAGVRLWTLMAEPRRVADICRTLTAEYDVDDATCESQILDLLAELQAEGMIESRDDATACG